MLYEVITVVDTVFGRIDKALKVVHRLCIFTEQRRHPGKIVVTVAVELFCAQTRFFGLGSWLRRTSREEEENDKKSDISYHQRNPVFGCKYIKTDWL